jgi:hypothetical protein
MRLPAFNATASLYRTSERYLTLIRAHDSGQAAVFPELTLNPKRQPSKLKPPPPKPKLPTCDPCFWDTDDFPQPTCAQWCLDPGDPTPYVQPCEDPKGCGPLPPWLGCPQGEDISTAPDGTVTCCPLYQCNNPSNDNICVANSCPGGICCLPNQVCCPTVLPGHYRCSYPPCPSPGPLPIK